MKTETSFIEINGIKYKWWISRQPQWCHEDSWQGVQLSIELDKEPKKQLLIQLPFEVSSRKSTPNKQRPKIHQADVVNYIIEAINNGWNPDSKGKPFRYDAS